MEHSRPAPVRPRHASQAAGQARARDPRPGRYHQTDRQHSRCDALYAEAITILERLASDVPVYTECQRALAVTASNLGILLRTTGRTTEAIESQRQAQAIFERLVRDHPAIAEYQSDLAACLNNIGGSLNDTGHAALRLIRTEGAGRSGSG